MHHPDDSTRTGDSPTPPGRVDVLVVGAGPAGASAAARAARTGRDVLLADAASWPRDKTCGDGLTPRALAELRRLGVADELTATVVNRGLDLTGFGHRRRIPWPESAFGTTGSAAPRAVLDDRLRRLAAESGAHLAGSAKAVGVEWAAAPGRSPVTAVHLDVAGTRHTVRCDTLIVADGVRSPLGRILGRTWHRETAYGVAARSYVASARHDAEWIASHLELRDPEGGIQPGYGWVFPLGTGDVNLGVGALATSARPAAVSLHPLLKHYAAQVRDEWGLTGDPRRVSSALLPMGGAVSGIAGPNWMLVGDAAACVNPLNGEGIDYALEGGRLAAGLLDSGPGVFTDAWPTLLREHYGWSFSVARRLAGLLTLPRTLPLLGPVGMGSAALMGIAVRVMGNLVTDADRDAIARLWRTSGRASRRFDGTPLFGVR